MGKKFPATTFAISWATFFASVTLATYLHGTPIATVTINELKHYGGVDVEGLSEGGAWALITCQLVHVKQLHMLFNVLSLFCLGAFIERVVGKLNVFLLWLIAGSFGTIAGAYFFTAPYNVGSGASQAVFAFMAASLVIVIRGYRVPKFFNYALFIIAMLSLSLDLFSVHYPKPGHLVGFIVGLCLSLFMVPKKQNT